MNYRKIWEDVNGLIPKDEEGRSYEIHHIDGDRRNNSIDNLICVSIEDHYKLHLTMNDLSSANMIAKRFNRTYTKGYKRPAEVVEKIRNKLKGKPNFKNSEILKNLPKVSCQFCGEERKINAINRHEKSCKNNPNRIFTPNLKASLTRRGKPQPNISKAKKGKPLPKSEDTKKKMRVPKKRLQCPHCNLIGGGGAMRQWHFNNCKLKK
jgi:hypothetical protein